MARPPRKATKSRSVQDIFLPILLFVAIIGASNGFVDPTPFHTTSVRVDTSALLASVLGDETVTESHQMSTTEVSKQPPTISSSSNDLRRTLEDYFPGRDENARFDCHDSVAIWRNFQATRFATFDENVRAISNVAAHFSTLGPTGGTYFAKHVARSAYFVVNALLGNAAFQLHERLAGRGGTKQSSAANAGGGAIRLLPLGMSGDVASRILLEAFMSYEQDYEWIRRGVYREPWDMMLGHRQSNLVNVLTQTGRLMRESIRTLAKRNQGTEQDKQVAFFGKGGVGIPPSLYPKYYQNAFHYQTDGTNGKG
jgi:hypothetical protein